ncbi:hypothetical protein GALL_354280 [mine drainage metagenome]|uniref:Uncharacterized protein n=1 Tax=mine drainage metagenome TaxID=410659 RepID=A0A1J5R3Q5_9ZZZZ
MLPGWRCQPRPSVAGDGIEAVIIDADPVAAPVAVVPAPQRHDDADGEAEADADAADDVARVGEIVGRVVGLRPGAIDGQRIVDRHIDDLRIRRFDARDGAVPGHLRLGRRGQRAGLARPVAQPLDRIHHLRLLRQEGVAQLLRPAQLAVHHLQDLREGQQRFDARVPVLRLQGGGQLIATKAGVAGNLQPARGLDDFERVGRRHQDLAEQLIGIERDRGQHLFELRRRERRRSLRVSRHRHDQRDRGDDTRQGTEQRRFHDRLLRPLRGTSITMPGA